MGTILCLLPFELKTIELKENFNSQYILENEDVNWQPKTYDLLFYYYYDFFYWRLLLGI